MSPQEALDVRLRSQFITTPSASVRSVVERLGAVQAQDFPAAQRAIGLRTSGGTQRDVDEAIVERAIVRSWPLRGTLHFCLAETLRPILSLTASRILRRNRGRYRQLELDEKDVLRAEEALQRAMEGNRALTRTEVNDVLARAGVRPDGQRSYHILNFLGLHGIICFGVPVGNQPTFVLVDEWLPPQPVTPGDEALSALARTYFNSRGPATIDDFIWWSGLTKADARKALQLLGDELEEIRLGDHPAWWGGSPTHADDARISDAHLLPAFDEYLIAYRDRSLILHPEHRHQVVSRNGIFWPIMVQRGFITGTWRSTFKKNVLRIRLQPFEGGADEAVGIFRRAAEGHARYLGADHLEFETIG